uniref:C-type lectin domain-containing protein n=1 Tax=Cyprinus carpio TaxID=7962 RepID=A0A8C2GKZ5_CYPCA
MKAKSGTQGRCTRSPPPRKYPGKIKYIPDFSRALSSFGALVISTAHDKLRNENCFFIKPFYCMTNFVLVRQKETWDGALEYCRTHYNNLASLRTKERMDSALLEITQAETEYVWTGLRFLAGDWLWVTGDALNYTAWYQNEQPQCPARHLQCGALDKQTKLWTHRNCEEKLSFFCQ